MKVLNFLFEMASCLQSDIFFFRRIVICLNMDIVKSAAEVNGKIGEPVPLTQANLGKVVLKGHSVLFLKSGKTIVKNNFTNMTSSQFLRRISLRKSKRKKNSCFPPKSQILLEADFTIIQFCKFLLLRSLLSTGLLELGKC